MNYEIVIKNQEEFDIRPLLPEDFKKQWVEALLSEKYQQGRKYLCFQNKYCCLGVACELVGFLGEPDDVGMRRTGEGTLLQSVLPSNFPYNNVLHTVGEFKGFNIVSEKGIHHDLTEINDNGFTFEEIAGIVEQYF